MKIVIIDDDKLVCQALKTILEADPDVTVPALGHSGQEAIALFKKYAPDILLMDIRMGEISGIEAGKEILTFNPDAKLLYLTTFADEEYIAQALHIGAKGYLLKQNFDSILPALRSVSSGQRVFGDEIISKLPGMMKKSSFSISSDFGLSKKELEIIESVAEGLSNKEIAMTHFLSEGTVRNYISIILEKLCLRDRTQLAIFYYKHNFSE